MAYIGKKPEDLIKGNATYNAFTGDGSTTTFDVTNLLPDGGQFDVEVFVDNVRQEAGSSKSYTIGQDGSGDLKRVTFNVAPDDGAEIYVINPGRETAIISVADNTITTAKLQDDAVTTAKITDSNVTTAKIAADAITGAKIADDAINSEHITDGSVDNVHLAGSIANAKLANSSITINGTSIALGASGDIVAGTDWQAVVVADGSTQLAAVAGRGYFLDTNLGVIEVTLPASPSRGDTFVFADYGNNFATNRVVIDTQGKLIDSTVGGTPDRDFVLETNGQVVELVFVDDTSGYLVKQNSTPSDLTADSYKQFIEATGGTITTSGDFKIHSFTGDGNFIVSTAGSGGAPEKVDYLVVAGGGSGGIDNGGGGGAGGYRESGGTDSGCYTVSTLGSSPTSVPGITVTATTYPITVGAGGAPGPGPVGTEGGHPGSNSVFSTITSAGGGGGSHTGTGSNTTNMSGGSGGAGGQASPSSCIGSGNTPPVSPPQGNDGGYNTPPTSGGGGGGGAGAAGNGGASTNGYNGGAGVTSCITGSPVARAGGGGGGGGQPGSGTGGSAGTGGGGAGGPGTTNGTAGSDNTGGGGGGGGQSPPSPRNNSGGKGVVIIRYQFQES